MSKKLTAKQQRFVEEYCIDFNASDAARRAGYSKKSAGAMGHENLQKPEIAAAIKAHMEKLAAGAEITAERVLKELGLVAFGNQADFARWDPDGVRLIVSDDLTREQSAIVSEVSSHDTKYGTNVRIKLHDKLGALDKLARVLQLYKDEADTAPAQTVFNMFMDPKAIAEMQAKEAEHNAPS